MTDEILGRPNPWADVFDANRIQALWEHAELAKDNVHVAKRFVADRVTLPGPEEPSTLSPMRGGRRDGQAIAVCRSLDGQAHSVDATCSHLGCLVAWNDAETSWDCPCHGSRFGPDGQVLTGPATAPLPRTDD